MTFLRRSPTQNRGHSCPDEEVGRLQRDGPTRISFKLKKSPKKTVRCDEYYITEKFQRRECSKFIPQSDQVQNRCKCGHDADEHPPCKDARSEDAHTSVWDPLQDTIKLPTNAYGEINFMSAENDILPMYLRCDIATNVEEIGTLLLERWRMPKPNLLISVFGGHSKFNSKALPAEMELEIKEGLVKAARDTKAWLFTSGGNHGVGRLVGNAVAMKRSFVNSIPVIGVNSWGAVANKDELIEKNGEGLFPAHYHSISLAELNLKRDDHGKPVAMALEHEHTHFILLDSGTKDNFHENEIREFRIKLQQHLVTQTKSQLVSILIEGGVGSLDEARMRVESDLPLVILGGSGRISDVLCLAWELAVARIVNREGVSRQVRKLQNEDDRMKVRKTLKSAMPGLGDEEYDRLLKLVEEVISHEDLVTIWRSGKSEKLDKTILRGLIKSLTIGRHCSNISELDAERLRHRTDSSARRSQAQLKRGKELMKRKLELTIKWNRLDIAKEYIFDTMSITLKESELNEMLGLAIRHKQVSFVRNIIKRNANIKSFLTVETFEEMLREDTDSKTLLYDLLLKQCSDRNDWRLEHFAKVVHHISEGVFKAPEKTRPYSDAADEPISSGMLLTSIKTCGRGNGNTYKHVHSDGDSRGGTNPQTKYDFEDPENLLALYMAMIHEQEMAKVFWEYSSSPLILGLVCSCVHKWMKNQEKETVLITDAMAENLEKHAKEFKKLVKNVLDEIAEPAYPSHHMVDLINFRYSKWGRRLTILAMADYTDAIDIIAHNSVQAYIDTEWNGCLDSKISTSRILISILCPLFASFRDVTPDKLEHRNKNANRQAKSRKQAFVDRRLCQDNSDCNEKKLSLLTKCKYFYKAPVVKFYIYMTFYFAFLFGYICALLLKDQQNTHDGCDNEFKFRSLFACRLTIAETFVYVWVFCALPVEIRQVYFSYPTTLKGKLKMYISNGYNKLDVMCYIIIMTALICKLTDPENLEITEIENWYENWFRLCFAFAFVLYCLRVCQALQKSKQLGPKVMMMQKMLTDLMFFILLVAIFLMGYGVSTSAIMNPMKEDRLLTPDMWFDIFWRPYMNLFGELAEPQIDAKMSEQYCILKKGAEACNKLTDIDTKMNKQYCIQTKGAEACTNLTDYTCAEDGNHICVFNTYIVKFLLGMYMMLAAVLMLNLLVAVFSSTYKNIEDRYAKMWKRQKFDLMMEFKCRSPLPVPFSTGLHLYRFVKLLFRMACGRLSGCCQTEENVRPVADERDCMKISLLETECRRNYLDKQQKKSEQEILQSDVKMIVKDVEDIKNNADKRSKEFESMIQRQVQAALQRVGVLDVASSPAQQPKPYSTGSDRSSYGIDDVQHDGIDLNELTDNPRVIAEETSPDMAVVEMEEILHDHVIPKSRKDSVPTSLKPIDLQRLLKMGKKSRKSEYPGDKKIRRAYIKKEHWDWHHDFLLNYQPLQYTDAGVPPEKKVIDIKWHSLVGGDERRSYEGRYEIRNHLPLNPCGRTGISGRGQLPKYGPNHLALPIITRYAKDERGDPATMAGKQVLEVVLECRENGVFSLPEIEGAYDNPLPKEILELITNDQHIAGDVEPAKVQKRIGKIQKGGILIYRGFLDSENNTDNSWLESIIVSYHDVNDNAFCNVAFPDDSKYKWCKVKSWTLINNMYREYLQKAFYARNAYDYMTSIQNPPLIQMGS